jgi:hypothetical protein
MAAFDPATLDRWRALAIVDRDGTTVGTISEFYLDRETGHPTWALVNTGLFGTTQTFVPLVHATEIDDGLQVPYEKRHIKDAPRVELHDELTTAEEATLFAHYGVEYGPLADEPEPEATEGADPGVATGVGVAEGPSPVTTDPVAGERLAPVPAEPGVAEASGSVATEPWPGEEPGQVPAEPEAPERRATVPAEPEAPASVPAEPEAAAFPVEPEVAAASGPVATEPGAEGPGPVHAEPGVTGGPAPVPAEPVTHEAAAPDGAGTDAPEGGVPDEPGAADPDEATPVGQQGPRSEEVAPDGFGPPAERREAPTENDPDLARTAPVEPGLPGSTAAAPYGPGPTTIDKGDDPSVEPTEEPIRSPEEAGWPPGAAGSFEEQVPLDRPMGSGDRWREARLAAERERIARSTNAPDERSPLERARRRLERLVGVGQEHPDPEPESGDISPADRDAAERARRARLGFDEEDDHRR